MADQQNPETEPLDVGALADNHTAPLPLSAWLKVAVKEPTLRSSTSSLSLQDSFIVYLIETTITDKSKVFGVWLEQLACEGEKLENEAFPDTLRIWRRYREFDLLKDYLMVTFPFLVIPPLPEKRSTASALPSAVTSTDKADPEFLERRRLYLEQFLKRLVEIAEVSQDEVLLAFLHYPDEWKDLVYASKYQTLKDSRLKSLSASYRIRRPNEKFEAIKKYANELQKNVDNVLKIRARTAEHLYGIHKIHSNYGREFSDWSSVARQDMAESLQKVGHYIDNFSQEIDICMEGEEDCSDQLREYHNYCDSLRRVCTKQELLQLEVEQCEDLLASKRTERDNFSQGKTGPLGGLKARVFGGATAEQKEGKLKIFDEQILELEEKLKAAQDALEKFSVKALASVEQFNRQKAKDITDILITYIVMTIERCKKGRAAWVNVKEACESM